MVPSLQSIRPRQRHHDRRSHHLRLVHLGGYHRGAVERVWSELGVGSTEYGNLPLWGESRRRSSSDFIASYLRLHLRREFPTSEIQDAKLIFLAIDTG